MYRDSLPPPRKKTRQQPTGPATAALVPGAMPAPAIPTQSMPADPPAAHALPPPFDVATVIVTGQLQRSTGSAGGDVQPVTNLPSASTLQLLTQGAEALVFKGCFLTDSTPCALKYRPPKSYRHPLLDKRLTRARLLAEARVLVRCRKEGVNVPGVLAADWEGK